MRPLITFCTIVAATVLSGCKTVDTASIATPARIEAVTALGAYYGAKALVAKGHEAELERALAGLRTIQASGTADLPAIVTALGAAGITFFDSPEGQLSLGAVVVFADAWANTAQPILDDERARAVLAGAIRGIDLALTPATRLPVGDPADTLRQAAFQSRIRH